MGSEPVGLGGLVEASAEPPGACLPAARSQLHRDKSVVFAGYQVPHPLEYRMLIRVSGGTAYGWCPLSTGTLPPSASAGRPRRPAAHAARRPPPPLQVQTYGEKTPIVAVQEALNGLATETHDVSTQFKAELQKHKSDGGGGGAPF